LVLVSPSPYPSPQGEGTYKEGLASLGLLVLKTDLEVGVTISL
jgi:hypothetical protein